MKNLIFVLIISISLSAHSQEVQVINAEDLQQKMLYTDSDLTVFNFWATWCRPCIKELPHFDEVGEKENVKVYLVSLDARDRLEKVRSLTIKKSLASEVLFLDEKDPETYIEKVSKKWTGAIPATLFITRSGEAYFHESAFTKEELEKTVNNYLTLN